MIKVDRTTLEEALAALYVREDWYISRGYQTPPRITRAIARMRIALEGKATP